MKASASASLWLASHLGFTGMLALCTVPLWFAEGYLLSRALAPPTTSAPSVPLPPPPATKAAPAPSTLPPAPPTPAPVVVPVEVPTNTPPPRPAMRTGSRAVAIEVYHAAGENAYARWTEGRHARGW